MSAREDILKRISGALGRPAPDQADAADDYAARLATPGPPRPRWSQSSRTRFLARLEAAAATSHALEGADGIAEAVAAYLAERDLPRVLHVGPHPLLDEVAWPDDWTVHEGLDEIATARVTLTVARFAIAETGTLMIPGDARSPTSLNLLSEHCLVVVRAADLVDYQEDAWAGLRDERADLPRAVMLVTGPSRTADIEQTLQLGAHGPRHLHVLLVD